MRVKLHTRQRLYQLFPSSFSAFACITPDFATADGSFQGVAITGGGFDKVEFIQYTHGKKGSAVSLFADHCLPAKCRPAAGSVPFTDYNPVYPTCLSNSDSRTQD